MAKRYNNTYIEAILLMKYPLHSPKVIESGQHTAKVEVKATTEPLFDRPNGVIITSSDEGELVIK